jgi:hypothetical protein
MAGPRRIQRMIFKGWRLPPDTVYVGRGSKWGNPFPFDHQVYLGKAWARDAYAQWLTSTLKGMALLREHLHELKGKNLACWCKAGEACHADVLIALANDAEDADASAPLTALDTRDQTETAASHP